jgi:hypothetical protein
LITGEYTRVVRASEQLNRIFHPQIKCASLCLLIILLKIPKKSNVHHDRWFVGVARATSTIAASCTSGRKTGNAGSEAAGRAGATTSIIIISIARSAWAFSASRS